MNIQNKVSLKAYNTFGIDAQAKYFVNIAHIDQLRQLYHDSEYILENKLIIGGGSNLLFTKDYEGIVAKIDLKGIEKIKETTSHVFVKCNAGENWHDFVLYTIDNNWAGLENLSLIPGCVGAAPLQNIGAYGVEIKDTFFELEALNIISGEIHIFNKADCKFGYRESVFKNEAKGNYVILSVTFKLNKQPKYHVEYGAIKDTLEQMNVKELSIKAVSDAVVFIRKSKLPNPAEIGNAGSFFKNPEINRTDYEQIKVNFLEIPCYPIDHNLVKVPAGWLIEKAGWKGYRDGDIGVHAKQALVLVNYGGGTGAQIKVLAEKIQDDISEKFGIKLQTEVNFV